MMYKICYYGLEMLLGCLKSVNFKLDIRNKKYLIKIRINRSEKRSEGLKVVNFCKKVIRYVFNSMVLVYNGRKFIFIMITVLKIGLVYKKLVLIKCQGLGLYKKKRK